jgi:hypothetical protein
MKNGLADAVRNNMPHGGTVELTVIQFSTGVSGGAVVEVGPVVVTVGNYETIATNIEGLVQGGGATPLAAGIDLATATLAVNAAFYTRQIVNIVTDGAPNVGEPNGETAAENARNNMITTLGLIAGEDEIDAEGVGITQANHNWLRDNIVWPQPGYEDWPPTGPGWIRDIASYTEFSETIAEKFEVLFKPIYMPRFVFEFDAFDGTGLFINGNMLQPPVCACNGPYVVDVEDLSVTLNGCGSYDSDGAIVNYEWSVGGITVYNGPACSYDLALGGYTPEGSPYTVLLVVTDNGGLTSNCDTTLTVTDGNCPAKVIMEEVCIGPDGTNSAYLKATGVVDHVGSGDFTITYDPTVVAVTSVDGSDFESMKWYDDVGTLTITAWNINIYLTGDFNIARITFAAVGIDGDSCTVAIDDSLLLTDDPSPAEVCHTWVDGTATIGSNGHDGDMNGDGKVNSGDVRYLAIYVASDGNDPEYSPLYPTC